MNCHIIKIKGDVSWNSHCFKKHLRDSMLMMLCKCYSSNEQECFSECLFETGSKPDVYVMGWSARLQSFTAPTETMCVWLSLTHLRNIVQCWRHYNLVSLTGQTSFISDLLSGCQRSSCIYRVFEILNVFIHSHGWLCFNVFQQSNAWWKLKTIVNCNLLTSQRRRLSWVQLAGHKGKPPLPPKSCTF